VILATMKTVHSADRFSPRRREIGQYGRVKLRRRSVVVALLATVGVSGAMGVAIAWSHDVSDGSAWHRVSSPTTATQQRPSKLSCPENYPESVPAGQRAGTKSAMIPGDPIAVLGCRFHSFSPRPPEHLTLAVIGALSPGVVSTALNSSPPEPVQCVVYESSHDVYLFIIRYAVGARLLVYATDCYATNGDLRVGIPGFDPRQSQRAFNIRRSWLSELAKLRVQQYFIPHG
jgi:hypothetical protein